MSPSSAFPLLLTPTEDNLYSLFERLQTKNPTHRELLDLKNAIDWEGSLRLRNNPAARESSSGTLIGIALYLSGPLLQWRGSDSDRYLELQLRALVGSLALLHHCGVTGLSGDVYNRLRTNIAGRFNCIVDGRRDSQLSLEERKSRSNALYLIRLADQAFSLFSRAQPLADALSVPIIGLVFAGAAMAGGQYNSLQSAFKYTDDIIRLIPDRPGRHLNLLAIQELARNAVVCLQDHETDEGGMADLEQAIVDAALVHRLLTDHLEEIPSRRSDAWDWPLARLRRGPPSLNKWYFFYGLLDCVAQLAPYHDQGLVQFPADLHQALIQLGKDTEWEEFGWKIEEILRPNDYEPKSAAGSGPSKPSSTTERPSKPSYSDPTGQKPPKEQYIEEDVSPWEQDGEPQVRQLLPRRALFHRGHRYTHAGVSTDCRRAFFHDSEKVRVYRTGANGHSHVQDESVFERKFQKSSPIAEVSLAEAVLAVSTKQTLELYEIGAYGPNRSPLETIQHGDWDPSGLGVHHRSASEVVVAVGQRRQKRNSNTREGRIILHVVMLSGLGSIRSKIVSSSTLALEDIPRSISFSGDHLVCITDVSNTVFVWRITGECFSTSEPAKIKRYDHKPETDSEGVTSAAIFQSQAGQSFVLCTSWAPTERYRSQGEWPFCSPVDPPQHVPPCSVHDLTALKDHRQLVAGAVSSVASIYAVLEKSGRVLLLRLAGHADGGIDTRDQNPKILRESLCQGRTSRGSNGILRFDPTGKQLYAVDPEGKMITVSFQPG
ncbi:MAG: hypothetical protein Q9194_005295 [Teloschistes cf. exilis]